MAEDKARPDTTQEQPTRIARLKDAVRHLKTGGSMALSDIDDLYAFLEEDEKSGRPDHLKPPFIVDENKLPNRSGKPEEEKAS